MTTYNTASNQTKTHHYFEVGKTYVMKRDNGQTSDFLCVKRNDETHYVTFQEVCKYPVNEDSRYGKKIARKVSCDGWNEMVAIKTGWYYRYIEAKDVKTEEAPAEETETVKASEKVSVRRVFESASAMYDYFTQRNRELSAEGIDPRDDRWAVSGVVVFSNESFKEEYPLENRSYRVYSNNKAFIDGMAGYSIFGDSLDGKDVGVRLDWYREWKVEKAYMEVA